MRYLACLVLLIIPESILTQDCGSHLSQEDKRILVNVLKWNEPVDPSSSGKLKDVVKNGGTATMECGTGFVQSGLIGKQYTFECRNGAFNRTFKYQDLLCRSDFHSNDVIEQLGASELGSKLLKCDDPNWKVLAVKVEKPDGKLKHLFTVCLDKKTMRPKFSFKPQSSDKPIVQHHSREDDVWGFAEYGQSAEERRKLSQGYTKRSQQNRITKDYPNKYDSRNPYPYYFNRGHLVAYADFPEHYQQKPTCQYLNAAPQWELLNKHSWTLVERQARTILGKDTEDWEVYTGTYGNIAATRGPLNLVAFFHSNGKFDKAVLPVPMLFWKIVHNTKDKGLSRAFVGVNNPEYKLAKDIPPEYKMCRYSTPKGDENKGFTYECPLDQFLTALSSMERVVK